MARCVREIQIWNSKRVLGHARSGTVFESQVMPGDTVFDSQVMPGMERARDDVQDCAEDLTLVCGLCLRSRLPG